MKSYLLLECSSGNVWNVADAIIKIDGIKMAHVVTGTFDVIQTVQTVDGVQKTQTAVAMPEQTK